jgi:hypothetical protein
MEYRPNSNSYIAPIIWYLTMEIYFIGITYSKDEEFEDMLH